MNRLAREIRVQHNREPTPSMVMIDAETVKSGGGGRTIGAKVARWGALSCVESRDFHETQCGSGTFKQARSLRPRAAVHNLVGSSALWSHVPIAAGSLSVSSRTARVRPRNKPALARV